MRPGVSPGERRSHPHFPHGILFVLLGILLGGGACAAGAGAQAMLQQSGRWPEGAFGTPLALALQGSHAYLGLGGGGLLVVDIQDPGQPQPTTELPIPARQLALSDALAVAVGQGRLTLLDLAEPARPVARGTLSLPEPAGTGPLAGCVIAGDHAFVIAGPDGVIWSVDLGNPDVPRHVGTYPTPGTAHGLALRQNRLYVADGDAGLQILDVSDPTRPARLGGYDTPGLAIGIDVMGSYAVVADFGSGLQLIDIRDPAHGAVVGTFGGNPTAIESFTHVQSVVVHGTHGYVVDAMSPGLLIIDLGTPSRPVLSGRMPGPPGTFPPYPMVWAGNLAFAGSSQDGLLVLDFANPNAPRRLATLPTRNDLVAVAALPGRAYVGDNVAGLHVLDLTQPSTPKRLGRIATGAYPEQVVGLPNAALLVENTNGFHRVTLVDTHDATRPRLGGIYHPSNILSQHLHVAAIPDTAYVAEGWDGPDPLSDPSGTGGALQVIDITDVSQPILRGRVSWTNWMYDVACSGGTVYVLKDPGIWKRGSGEFNLVTVDAQDAAHPRAVGEVTVGGYPSRILVSGTLLHLGQFDGHQVFDIRDPLRPVPLGSVRTDGIALHDMAVDGDRVYRVEPAISGTGLAEERLVVIDTRDPVHLRIIAQRTLPYREAVAAWGGHGYLTETDYLHVWELVEPRTRFIENRLDGGRLHLRWQLPEGMTARLQRTRSLSPAVWEPVPGTQGLLGTNLPAQDVAGFFRLVTP